MSISGLGKILHRVQGFRVHIGFNLGLYAVYGPGFIWG